MSVWNRCLVVLSFVLIVLGWGGAASAAHLQRGAAASGGEDLSSMSRQPEGQVRRRSGGPSENARFLSRPRCETGCLPGGYLLDFGSGGGTGPPGSLPRDPPPEPVVVAPLPGSVWFMIAGLGGLALLSRAMSRAPPG